ncbi:MAG TPA: metallophosphoesterase, partial [Gemmatimonadaceae bacterium]
LALACSRDEKPTPPPGGPPKKEVPLAGAAVMVGAGDIAVCGTDGDEATGHMLDSILVSDSAAGIRTEVFTLGDNAYPSGPNGVEDDFSRCFAPTWGSPRVMRVIHPAPGNHDYDSGSGDPYFQFFGDRAGPPGKGYYSYDFNGWHVVSLNSELYFDAGNAAQAKAEEEWLRQDLASHSARCTLAYFHRPLFNSGHYGNIPEMRTVWNILYEHGADLVLSGHEHHYERFIPQRPDGVADSARGIEEIIAGTGGGALTSADQPRHRNSAIEVHGRFGLLKLELTPEEYRYAFIGVDGRVWDTGGRKCI